MAEAIFSESCAGELRVALSAVAAACRIARLAQPGAGEIPKPDGSPVTVADYAAQAAACRIISSAFPEDAIIAEECAGALRHVASDALVRVAELLTVSGIAASPAEAAQWIEQGKSTTPSSRRFWMLDPIDGTRGYLQKGHYCTALALFDRGALRLAAIGCPSCAPGAAITAQAAVGGGALYFAERGRGAFEAPLEAAQHDYLPARQAAVRLHVSKERDIHTASMCQRRHPDNSQPAVNAFRNRLAMRGPLLVADSQVKYCALARGDVDVYIRPRKHPDHRDKVWDHAAGVLLVEEAGGRASDLDGMPLDFSLGAELSANNGILATNGLLHKIAVQGGQAGSVG